MDVPATLWLVTSFAVNIGIVLFLYRIVRDYETINGKDYGKRDDEIGAFRTLEQEITRLHIKAELIRKEEQNGR